MTLANTLRRLVDAVHDGNVNAAARDIGVLQQTLDRAVRGEVKNPRADFLKAVARFYGVTVDWLLYDGRLAADDARRLRVRVIMDRIESEARGSGLAVTRRNGQLIIRP